MEILDKRLHISNPTTNKSLIATIFTTFDDFSLVLDRLFDLGYTSIYELTTEQFAECAINREELGLVWLDIDEEDVEYFISGQMAVVEDNGELHQF